MKNQLPTYRSAISRELAAVLLVVFIGIVLITSALAFWR